MIEKRKSLLAEVKVLYEDENFIVLNKPAGLVVHYDGRTKEESLVDWLLEKYPEMEDVGEAIKLSSGKEIKKSGVVHRLDKETSGAIVSVKSQEAFDLLKKQFQNREVKKKYHAFVYGKLNLPDVGQEEVIDRPIGRSRKDFRLRSAQRGARGKIREAITRYKILKRNDNFSFVEIMPLTGRTHQIRVHFKAINHPVVCDRLYAPKRDCALGFERLALHSFNIKFKDFNGKDIDIEAPYFGDFQKALNVFNSSDSAD